MPSVTPFFKMPFELAVTDANGNTNIIRLAQDTPTQFHRIAMPTSVTSISFDPRVFLVAKSTISRNNSFVIDDVAPKIVSFNPAHQAEGVALDANLEMTFDEPIRRNVGKVFIKKISDESVFHTFEITNTSTVNITGAKAILNPPNDFEKDEEYYVEVESGAVWDNSNNLFAGFSGKDTWKFSTKNTVSSLSKEESIGAIYPNPTKGIVNIENPSEKLLEVSINNTLGQVVREQQTIREINLVGLPQGVYYAKIKDGRFTKVIKIIKQ
jgi:hypothetical protein